MKNIVAICLVLLTAGISSGQDRSGAGDIRNKFAGAWRLVWLERPGADRRVQRLDCSGSFVFPGDGHASVRVMERNPEAQAAVGPQQYSAGMKRRGAYNIDERAHTFTFHIEGALVRSLIEKELPACIRVLRQATHCLNQLDLMSAGELPGSATKGKSSTKKDFIVRVPGMRKLERIEENLRAADVRLTKEELIGSRRSWRKSRSTATVSRGLVLLLDLVAHRRSA